MGGAVACGAGTDQLALDAVPEGRAGLAAVIDAYREQIEVVADAGATSDPDGLARARPRSPQSPRTTRGLRAPSSTRSSAR